MGNTNMTKLALTFDRNAEFYPVKFSIYRLLTRDILDKETKEVIVPKGRPDNRTMHTITLMRRVRGGKVETVGDTIKRLKAMIEDGVRYSILSAPETDDERDNRRARQGLEVVVDMSKPTGAAIVDALILKDDTPTEVSASMQVNVVPITTETPAKSTTSVVSDEDLGITVDDGRIKPKKASRKTTKVAKAA